MALIDALHASPRATPSLAQSASLSKKTCRVNYPFIYASDTGCSRAVASSRLKIDEREQQRHCATVPFCALSVCKIRHLSSGKTDERPTA